MPAPIQAVDLVPGMVTSPLSVRGVASIIDQLPAADRAALAWAPTRLQSEIRSLLEGPLTKDRISAASSGVLAIFARLLPAMTELLGAESLSEQLDAASRSELERLRTFLPDDGARRSADWVFEAFRTCVVALSHIPHSELVAATSKPIAEADLAMLREDDAIGLFNGLVLIMAAFSIVDQAGDRERAAELCDLAFLETSRGVDSFAAAGVKMTDDVRPALERGAEILRIVEDARISLTPDDLETLAVGRLHDLR